MESEPSAPSGEARKGALAVGYALIDAYLFGVPIAAIAIWGNVLVAFVLGAVAWTLANIAACNWVDRDWAAFAAGSGKKIEAKLQKVRSSSVPKPCGWMDREGFGFLVRPGGDPSQRVLGRRHRTGSHRITGRSEAHPRRVYRIRNRLGRAVFALIGYAAAAAGI